MAKTFGKKALTVMGVAGLVVGGAAAGLGAGFGFDDSKDIDALNLQVEDLQTQIDDAALVEPEVVEIEVDNENLGLVLDHIYDNDGDVDYLIDDLDDDEVEEIVDRIIFENEVRKLAVDEVKKNLFDEIDDRKGTWDEDDMDKLRIQDDFDEIEFSIDDWDDKEATITIKGTFEYKDIQKDFTAELEFDDGEFDEFRDIKVNTNLI